MKKLLLLGLLVVVGIQPRLFTAPPIEDFGKLAIADEEPQEEESTFQEDEAATEDAEEPAEGDDEAQDQEYGAEEVDASSVDSQEVVLIYEYVDGAQERLKHVERYLRALADEYRNSAYILPDDEISKVHNALKGCVEEFNKFAGSNLELINNYVEAEEAEEEE